MWEIGMSFSYDCFCKRMCHKLVPASWPVMSVAAAAAAAAADSEPPRPVATIYNSQRAELC